ncbi:MAG: FAD-dependent oxidoreductase, partial [Gammaproteobacteria bacterium]|nr:FAD-dependent oxidoreductase [Gammaproteobacteria bacterium]
MVVGAGAAGLAATVELARSGLSVVLLEARDRIGGRIWTRHEPNVPVPLELGAEFIHGRAKLTRRRLAAAHALVARVANRHYRLKRGVPSEQQQYFEELRRALSGTRLLDRRDLSFAQLVLRLRPVLSTRAAELARLLAEGFDAVDTRIASARTIREEWCEGLLSGAPQSRPRA